MNSGPLKSRKFLHLLLIGPLLALSAGCTQEWLRENTSLPLEDFSEVVAAKEPKASLVQYQHEIHFPYGEDTLVLAERERLSAFFDRTDLGYGDRVHVIAARAANGGRTEDAQRLDLRRKETVTAYLRQYGVRVDPLLSSFGAATSEEGAVRVVVRRYVVTLPACPDWTAPPGHTFNNQPRSNWGCATATNLGMMVADPGDLVRGRGPGPRDGETAARSVRHYRQDATKPLLSAGTGGQDTTATASGDETSGGGGI